MIEYRMIHIYLKKRLTQLISHKVPCPIHVYVNFGWRCPSRFCYLNLLWKQTTFYEKYFWVEIIEDELINKSHQEPTKAQLVLASCFLSSSIENAIVGLPSSSWLLHALNVFLLPEAPPELTHSPDPVLAIFSLVCSMLTTERTASPSLVLTLCINWLWMVRMWGRVESH